MPIVIYGKASLIACTDYLKKIIDLEKKKKKKGRESLKCIASTMWENKPGFHDGIILTQLFEAFLDYWNKKMCSPSRGNLIL